MTSLVLTNNAQSTLASPLGTGDTTLTVAAGQGARFPSPGANEWFPLSLISADGSTCEIVRATARTGDDITIVRDQEGTTAVALVAGDYVLHQMTAAAHLDLASQDAVTIPTSAGTSSAYTVDVDGVTSLENGLAFGFEAHATNVGAATLKIGALAAKTIQRQAYDGSGLTALLADEMLIGKQAIVHYNASGDVFILSNPNRAGVPSGSDTVEGTLQLASDPQTYDPTSGDDSRPVTQLTASQIAEDAINDATSGIFDTLPFMWRHKGNGDGGNFTIGNGNTTQIRAGNENQYGDFTVAAGGTMSAGDFGCRVLRCTGDFTCAGEVILHRANSRWPERVIGPTGSSRVVGGDQNDPVVQQQMWTGLNPINNPDEAVLFDRFLTVRQFEMGVQGGWPFRAFTGGHGDGNNTFSLPASAGGGCVIIAENIDLQAGGLMSNGHALDGAFEGPSAGAMVILVANSITIDPTFEFELGLIGVPNNQSYYETQRLTDIEDLTGAGNGHLFTMNLTTGQATRVF